MCLIANIICYKNVLICWQLTDDTTWVEEALDDLLETGLIIVEIDIDFWITIEGTDEVIPPPDIVDNICVNECSGNGLCIESKIYIAVLLF